MTLSSGNPGWCRNAAAAWRMRACGLVSTVGITDIPGRSSTAEPSSRSSAIFTGIRCTTFVKLPVALSGGSNANSWPLAGAQAPVADNAVDRRDDRGVFEIELGLAPQRLGARQRRIGLNDLGLEQVDLLHGGGKVGGVARDRGLRTGVTRLRLLRVLDAAET